MRIPVYSLFFVFAIGIFACDEHDERLDCCDFEISYDLEYSLNFNWLLVGIIRDRPFFEECTDGAGGWVSFQPDGSIAGSTACNRLMGSYETVGKNGLKISSLGQTLRLCVGNESGYWEGLFPGELKNARHFKIEGNKLVIFTSSGKQMVFKAMEH